MLLDCRVFAPSAALTFAISIGKIHSNENRAYFPTTNCCINFLQRIFRQANMEKKISIKIASRNLYNFLYINKTKCLNKSIYYALFPAKDFITACLAQLLFNRINISNDLPIKKCLDLKIKKNKNILKRS